jgi:aminoglycoside 6'-N-acetyltransferase
VELRGEQVLLRPLRDTDLAVVAAIQAEPAIARWWGEPKLDELEAKAAGTDDAVAYAIEHEGAVVGLIQSYEHDDPEFRHAGIDLFLAERVHGRGLGPDAIRALARHLIDDEGHHRLVIDPAADNAAAIRAYEKVGFRRVGTLREYWRAPDGTWRDGLLMDLLAPELL